ncbi:MAG: BolA family transcriptional regulator [Gammaproteobacteria bacterium]|nr:BolA family transcriptional regulator [Gammaproteobacteria bacterium]
MLTAAFQPAELLVKDQSQLHVGHAGAEDGRGHFDVTIVAEAFAGTNRLQRHRMIYDVLGDLMTTDIHALRIKAFAPDER